MEKLSGKQYIDNEFSFIGPLKNKFYSILGKGPSFGEIYLEVQNRRGKVDDLLNNGFNQ